MEELAVVGNVRDKFLMELYGSAAAFHAGEEEWTGSFGGLFNVLEYVAYFKLAGVGYRLVGDINRCRWSCKLCELGVWCVERSCTGGALAVRTGCSCFFRNSGHIQVVMKSLECTWFMFNVIIVQPFAVSLWTISHC